MSIGVLAGFNPTLLTTTAATLIRSGGAYVTARLVNATTACTLTIYNHNAATPVAANRVAILKTFGRGADELGAPIRCDIGVVVKMSINNGTAFIYVR